MLVQVRLRPPPPVVSRTHWGFMVQVLPLILLAPPLWWPSILPVRLCARENARSLLPAESTSSLLLRQLFPFARHACCPLQAGVRRSTRTLMVMCAERVAG